MGKRGVSYLIISMILVLILVGIGFVWIFQEQFGQSELDYESCRNSVLLRSSLPEADLLVAVASSKDTFNLKCKTQTLNIDYKDVERAENEIAKEIASCWYLYGKGELQFFPNKPPKGFVIRDSYSPCMICSEIRIVGDDVKKFYEENKINIERALMEREISKGETYYEYLNEEGGVKAFRYLAGWSDEGFEIDKNLFGMTNKSFYYPKYYDIDPGSGNLFIIFAHPSTYSLALGDIDITKHIIFMQSKDLDKIFDDWRIIEGFQVCSSINTIP